jgi:hypothetical protein
MSSSPDSSPSAMNAVQYSFRLGWRFAQMYHDPHRASRDAGDSTAKPPLHLPGVSELSTSVRAALLLGEIQHDLDSLCAEDSLAQAPMSEVRTSMTKLADVMTGPAGADGKRAQILQTYTLLRLDVGAADAHSGTALDLGRMLADTVLLADAPATYLKQFGAFRLANFYGWLEDLHASFPAHAADTVRGSLQVWQVWVSEHKGTAAAGQSEGLRRALDSQGERWRRLLSGEILALDLLSADDYRAAAANLLGRLRSLAGNYVRRFWPVIAIILAATAAIAWAIVTYAAAGIATIVGLIATAAGSLGVSWKAIGSTLGQVAAKAEDPLWDAEVTESLVVAATIPPPDTDRKAISAMRKKAADISGAPGPIAKPASAESPELASPEPALPEPEPPVSPPSPPSPPSPAIPANPTNPADAD